jgi:uncharacterized short protein YbdD (DUF466 family)
MKYLILTALLLVGCSDPYDECVSKKQESWRQSNPNADYAKATTANERFMRECSSLKKK